MKSEEWSTCNCWKHLNTKWSSHNMKSSKMAKIWEDFKRAEKAIGGLLSG